jgi:hypothetical protein
VNEQLWHSYSLEPADYLFNGRYDSRKQPAQALVRRQKPGFIPGKNWNDTTEAAPLAMCVGHGVALSVALAVQPVPASKFFNSTAWMVISVGAQRRVIGSPLLWRGIGTYVPYESNFELGLEGSVLSRSMNERQKHPANGND